CCYCAQYARHPRSMGRDRRPRPRRTRSAVTEAALSLRDAGFGYAGRTRVAELNLEVRAGDAVARIGPNGSGKPTLVRGVLGLAELTRGSIRVLGTDPAAARKHIGSLPQSDTRDTTLPLSLRQVVNMGLYRSRGPLTP